MKKVVIDGQVLDEEQATVSVFDRGFLYGDSVFETVRTYGGRPFALDEHLERLQRSADRVRIRLPVDASTIADEVRRGIEAAGNEESYVRIMVTRGSGPLGLDPTLVTDSRRVIIVAPLVPPPPEAYENGVTVTTLRAQRPTDRFDAEGAKVANYLVAVLAAQKARESGAHEGLILDSEGRVLEGGTSNIFALSGNRLVTPSEDERILPGITRARVIEAARDIGLEVVLEALPMEELLKADEVFLTSSIREVLPVVGVDGQPIGDGRPGPGTRRLHTTFREKAHQSR